MDKKAINPTACIGIDVSKYSLDVYISKTGEHVQVKNEKSGYLAIIKKLKISEPVIVMEATGGKEKKAATSCGDVTICVI